MVVGIIIAVGIAVGSAIGLWQVGEGVKKRQEAVGEGIAKAVTWVTLAAGICVVLALLMFFMTRSRAKVGPGGKIATVEGGGTPGK
jgi:ABC-type Fe3+ transport system permease subunit